MCCISARMDCPSQTTMHFTEFNQRVRDVAVNPYTGSIYLALNGPYYTGMAPTSSRNSSQVKPLEWHLAPERGIDIFLTPPTSISP